MTMNVRNVITMAVLAAALSMSGCRSAQDKANDAAIAQAKLTAAQTGAPQQVVWTDKDGTTTTTIVQPPAPGQTTQQLTTTKNTATTNGGSTTRSTTTTSSMSPVVTPVQPAAISQQPVGSAPGNAPAEYAAPVNGAATQGPVAGVSQPVISPVNVQVPRGTTLAIRMNQRIDVKTAHAGERFSGEVARGVVADGREVIPRGTPVEGVIDASHRRGHFKGSSILELRLTSMRLNGTDYGLDTRDNTRTKKGKGKRSAAFIGGGAGLGMLVGGVASGGVGLLVGGLAGGGAGTLLGGLTGNRDLVIPAESVVDFRLADNLVVTPR